MSEGSERGPEGDKMAEAAEAGLRPGSPTKELGCTSEPPGARHQGATRSRVPSELGTREQRRPTACGDSWEVRDGVEAGGESSTHPQARVGDTPNHCPGRGRNKAGATAEVEPLGGGEGGEGQVLERDGEDDTSLGGESMVPVWGGQGRRRRW